MAGPAQQEFIESCLARFEAIVSAAANILEVGSQDINGSIRDYFPAVEARSWVGLDVGKGKRVDFRIPGELIQLPDGWADIAFSTECFEHAKSWREIFLNMIRVTRENGLIILTFAGMGRAAHGTIDTDPASSPYTNDYYKNISPAELSSSLQLDKYFSRYSLEVNLACGDTYFWGLRTSSTVDTEWMSPEESLARARGQLGLIVSANRELQRQLQFTKSPLPVLYRGLVRMYQALRK